MKPIILIGMGRSGTTIVFEALARHPKVGFFSNYTDKFFKLPQISIVHRFLKFGEKPQGQRTSLFNKFLPKTSEAYYTWSRLCGDKFRFSFMKNIKPTSYEIDKVKSYVSKILYWEGKERFIMKITGPPRLEFLHGIFPDAYFVDIIRDPRAVVASLLNVSFWKQRGLTKPFWENTLDEETMDLWKNKYDSTPESLAALENLEVYKQTNKELKATKANYLRIKYEDFVANPIEQTKIICNFSNLDWSEKIGNYINSKIYKNMNYKYKERLTKEQIRIIEEISAPIINEIGYR